ncbi:MAG: DUF3084 domain-containing protein [Candidatus Eremiobacteraeota bacterium]|nr:DUF3084 domain-containing protein [Candidatus Eremiobacteraeota bacterium]MCW5867597.1 DUF3084 domain-containing protein [Candidatus Eremiobacteraeota bacterium]
MDYAALRDPWVWTRIGSIYLLVAVVAGCIAYMGNDLGKKIGKKKRSLFGLRPKHTSNLITALVGSLIAVVTLTLVLIFSQEARYLLTGIDRLRAQIEFYEAKVKELRHQVDQSRIVWGTGQPILSGTLDPHVNPDAQRALVLNQLRRANIWSIQRNNDIAKEKREDFLSTDSQLLEWDEAELDRIVEEMASEDKVVGVRILAARNCLYKDKVPVKLELMPVTRVFQAGEVVAAHSLQPDNPELLREWYDFLAQIRETALRRGMIEINDSLGGGLTSEDFDRLIEDIKRLQGPGKLVAVATTDLYQTNTLAIRVEVVPDRVGHTAHRDLAARRGR